MKKKRTNTRGIWFGLVGLVIGLALGYLGSSVLGQGGLLGSSIESDAGSKMDLEATLMSIQMEKASLLDKQMEKQMKELKEKTESGTMSTGDLMKLQKLMNDRKQGLEVTSNLMKKYGQALDEIVKNMK
jgi:hypothetical protein